MKAIVILFLMASSAFAQTNEVIKSLVTPSKTYSNAVIKSTTPEYAIVYHDGGIAKIPLENLPKEIQRKLQYDPAKAIAFQNAERQKQDERLRKIAERQALLSKSTPIRGDAKRIVVTEVIGNLGYDKCNVEFDGHGAEILIHLPPQLKKYLDDAGRLEKQIAASAEAVKEEIDAAEKANATAPTSASGNAAYVDAAMAERTRANLMMLNAKKSAERLSEARTILARLRNLIKSESIFMAAPTGKLYGPNEIWEYVGPAVRKRE